MCIFIVIEWDGLALGHTGHALCITPKLPKYALVPYLYESLACSQHCSHKSTSADAMFQHIEYQAAWLETSARNSMP